VRATGGAACLGDVCDALNTRTGALEYSNAGHHPPYIFHPAEKLRSLKERRGPILGVFDGYQYATRNSEVRPGEGILLFTDGVTEAYSKSGDFCDESRLEAYLAAHASRLAEELVRGLHAGVKRFESGIPHADDITMLAVRRHA
jgi:sigma-B regulation protein RsbU (phosphoserine phosphatase)